MFRVAVIFSIGSDIPSTELAKISGYEFKATDHNLHFSKEGVSLDDIPNVPMACVVVTDSLGVSMTNYNGNGWEPVFNGQVIPELFAVQVW